MGSGGHASAIRNPPEQTGSTRARLFVGRPKACWELVTEPTLKLPLSPLSAPALLPSGLPASMKDAPNHPAIFAAGIPACALEVADAFTLDPPAARTQKHSAQLMSRSTSLFELDGQESSVAAVKSDLCEISRPHHRLVHIEPASSPSIRSRWKTPPEFSYSLLRHGPDKLNEDIVVPRGPALEDLFAFTRDYKAPTACPIALLSGPGRRPAHTMSTSCSNPSHKPGASARSHCLDDLSARSSPGAEPHNTGEHGNGLAKMPLVARSRVAEVRGAAPYNQTRPEPARHFETPSNSIRQVKNPVLANGGHLCQTKLFTGDAINLRHRAYAPPVSTPPSPPPPPPRPPHKPPPRRRPVAVPRATRFPSPSICGVLELPLP